MISTYQIYIASVHGYGASILPLYQQKLKIQKKEERKIEETTAISKSTNDLKQSQLEHKVNFLI